MFMCVLQIHYQTVVTNEKSFMRQTYVIIELNSCTESLCDECV